MLGTIINGVTIVVCSLIAIFFAKVVGKDLPKRFEEIIIKALGLSVLFIGISGALETNQPIILILSLVIGGIIGELINIDKGMKYIGDKAEEKLNLKESSFSKGFVTASILFCSGSMAIIGAMEGGLTGDHEMLITKAILDGTISLIFAYQLGIGVAFSAIPVVIYQGAIALISMGLSGVIPMEIITEMGAAGSLVIAAIGINFILDQEIRVANYIPAVFVPIILINIINLF